MKKLILSLMISVVASNANAMSGLEWYQQKDISFKIGILVGVLDSYFNTPVSGENPARQIAQRECFENLHMNMGTLETFVTKHLEGDSIRMQLPISGAVGKVINDYC